MNKLVSIAASYPNPGVDWVPSAAADRMPIAVELTLTPADESSGAEKRLRAAELVVRAREIFSGATREVSLGRLDEVLSDDVSPAKPFIVTHGGLTFPPGVWVLLVDLVAEGESLAGEDVGCCCIYARKPDESIWHAKASWNFAMAELAWDEATGVYGWGYHAVPPATGDPFTPAGRERFVTATSTAPELQHDGASGFLFGAHVFRVLGETDRAEYCEGVVRRTISLICGPMHAGDGQLQKIDVTDGEVVGTIKMHPNQDSWALKLLAQSYFYFAHGAGDDAEYGRSFLEMADRMFDHQLNYHPLEPGLGGENCKVYDGRCLAGLAWHLLVRRAETGGHGDFHELVKIVYLAKAMGSHCIAHQDWYDAGCLVESQCHPYCGNMNLLNGLLTTLHILRQRRTWDNFCPQNIEHMEIASRSAMRFLTHTSGTVTGQMPFIPTRTSAWAAGNMYEVCDEYLRTIGDDPAVRRMMDHLVMNAPANPVECFHRNNSSGAAILHCDEYRDLTDRPPLPWQAAFDKLQAESDQ